MIKVKFKTTKPVLPSYFEYQHENYVYVFYFLYGGTLTLCFATKKPQSLESSISADGAVKLPSQLRQRGLLPAAASKKKKEVVP